jgi:hypothetical protein
LFGAQVFAILTHPDRTLGVSKDAARFAGSKGAAMGEDDRAATPFWRRAAALVLTPRRAWAAVEAEASSVRGVFFGYVAILGAINPVCFALGRVVFGETALGVAYRPPLAAAAIEALAGYVLSLGSVFALGGLIAAYAGPFGGSKDRGAAFKVAAYATTPAWLASVLHLYPPAGVIALVGQVYSLYLLHLGIGTLIRPTARRTLGYTALAAVSYVVLMMLVISLTKLLAAAVL